jgi:hypothetical protein
VAVLKEKRGWAHTVAVAAAEVLAEVLEVPEVVEELLPQLASRNMTRERNMKLKPIFPRDIFPTIAYTGIRYIFSPIMYWCARTPVLPSYSYHQSTVLPIIGGQGDGHDPPYHKWLGLSAPIIGGASNHYFLATNTRYSVAKLI